MSLYLGENCISAGGSSAFKNNNLGEIIQSTIPLTDAGLHLLDGSLISGSGSYSAFVTYIAGLVSNYPDLFTTETAWQQAVTDYGVCGKFVYDSTNNTVRLPKYSNKIYTSAIATTAGVKGNGKTLGVTNGTDNAGVVLSTSSNNKGSFVSYTGNYGGTVGTTTHSGTALTNGASIGVTTDASKSGLIADLSNITTSLDGYYYIVIANSVKTNIEVDIDEIMTDLNGKADVDLSNSSVPHIVETYVNGTSWYRVWSDGWCEQGGMHSAGQNVAVTLLKPYRDTNYIVLLTGIASSQAYTPLVRSGNTATNFHVFSAGNGSHSGFWQACGYIN